MNWRRSLSKHQKPISPASLFRESDKGCAIIVGTLLEHILRDIHEAHIYLAVSEGTKFYKELFANAYAPLATFGGVIQFGYAYGLISAEDYRDLNLIRKIRNEAAHCPCEFSLNDSGVRLLLVQLSAASRIEVPNPVETNENLSEAKKLPLDQVSEARSCFINNGLALQNFLAMKLCEKLERVIEKRNRESARLRQPRHR